MQIWASFESMLKKQLIQNLMVLLQSFNLKLMKFLLLRSSVLNSVEYQNFECQLITLIRFHSLTGKFWLKLEICKMLFSRTNDPASRATCGLCNLKCSLKICYPLLPYSQRKKRCRRAKICDLCTAGGPPQLKHQKSADMKYLADNFQDNCQGCWIFQMARAKFFRLSGPNFSVQIDRLCCNLLDWTHLIKAKCFDHVNYSQH